MKHISQIAQRLIPGKSHGSFPKTADQKALERQRGEMDSFMLSFSTHEAICESIRRTLFEIYKARNMSGMLLRELRVEDFAQLKDGFKGTFEQRISELEDEMETILDSMDRDKLCARVVELLNAALVAASYGGTFDDEVYESWKADPLK